MNFYQACGKYFEEEGFTFLNEEGELLFFSD